MHTVWPITQEKQNWCKQISEIKAQNSLSTPTLLFCCKCWTNRKNNESKLFWSAFTKMDTSGGHIWEGWGRRPPASVNLAYMQQKWAQL